MALGRPVSACLTPAVPAPDQPATDKWTLLAALTDAAPDYGLTHRTLSVLRALLSFFPERELPGESGGAVVFPSNRTLSLRLNGMPESTLRRHLATLVQNGIVSRQDSPNRKRFARKYGLPFGFDLSPLGRAAADILQAAERARTHRQHIAALRDRLALIRSHLRDTGGIGHDHPLLEQARLILRRKVDKPALLTTIQQLETLVEKPEENVVITDEMSVGDSQNERHIQSTSKKTLVKTTTPVETDSSSSEITLADVLNHCTEYKDFFPDVQDNWHGVLTAADQVHGMLGISRAVYQDAQTRIGSQTTATIVLCMLERITTIRTPGAYLRGLIRRFDEGRLNIVGMLRSLSSGKLSADNFCRSGLMAAV